MAWLGRRHWRAMLAAAALTCFAAAGGTQTYIWLEAEKPAWANFKFQTWGGENPQILSDGKWLTYTVGKSEIEGKIPRQGLLLRYSFSATEAGLYEVWLRLGYEFIRAPLQWRVDGRPWKCLPPSVQTTNLMEVTFWCEVAWVKAGLVNLSRGSHTFELRYGEPGPDGRLLIGLDCIAFIKSEGGFAPEGPLRPGQQYNGATDRAARSHVFRFEGPLPTSPGERIELALGGPWEVARWDDPDMDTYTYEPIKKLPNPTDYPLRWMGIEVAGDARRRPELRFGHRLLYRTRVQLPAALKGRSFHLHFGGTCWIASVFVNGRYVGSRQSVLVPWDLDITGAIRPGSINTIVVGIKSGWYALDSKSAGKSLDHLRNTPGRSDVMRHRRFVAPIFPSSKGEGNGLSVGLVNPVKLVVAGPVYTSDIFIRTSVEKMRLDADVTVVNTTDRAVDAEIVCEAVNERTGEVEKRFGPVAVRLQAQASKRVAVGGDWPKAKLWWPEEDPNLYVMRTRIRSAGRTLDLHEQLFGFREVAISGKHILLNGVRWHFWNWVGLGKVESQQEWLEKYREQNNRFHRIENERFLGGREKALEFFDRHGIPGRLSTCIDGMYITYDLDNPLVWENFKRHVAQVVRAYRNHPSIVIYSLGNELMFINARLRGTAQDYLRWEAKAAELHDLAGRLDPTRPSFQDGGGDLGGRLSVNCQHYSWPCGGSVPPALYAYPIRRDQWVPSGKWDRGTERYMWDGKRPLVLGEVFYYSGDLSAMAWVGGPDVYRGRAFADAAAARFARMAIEGARWQEVAAICPWVEALPGASLSFEPRAVFVREHNSCFYPRATLRRTIKIFNDGRRRDPLTLKWHLVFGDRTFAEGEKTYTIEPGHSLRDSISAPLPDARRRTDGRLELELLAGGKRVFRDSKAIAILPPPPSGPVVKGTALAVFDPEGDVRKWLAALGQDATFLQSLDAIPGEAGVLLVGRNALPQENRTRAVQAIRRFVLEGKSAIVLEQDYPLSGDELPVSGIEIAKDASGKRQRPVRPEFESARGRSGCICFPVAPAHPVLRGLKPGDFFTWAGDERSFRNSYRTPAGGVIAIVQAGDKLALTPMLEIPVGRGAYLLSQLLIGEKLGVEPVTDRLLYNLLTWAAERAGRKPARTAVFLGGDRSLAAFLEKTLLEFDPVDEPAAAIGPDFGIAVVRATPSAMAWLRRHKADVRSFCSSGKWLMVVGLDEKGLAAFNDLVAFHHRLRPGRREAVVLQSRNDPLLLGLSDRDVSMVSDQWLARWKNLRWVSDRVFTAVVDGRDIASFARFDRPDLAKLANGLTNDDFWRYIVYFNADGDSVTLRYDRPEVFTQLNIWSNPSYFFIKDIEIAFDDRDVVIFTLERRKGKQELKFPPRRASKVTIRIKSHYPGASKKNLVGIDNVELFRKLPPDFDHKVVMLTKPGGLVKYPIGKGGIVLNQVDYARKDTAENVRKKITIYSNLLRNMGATFAVAARAGRK